MVNQKLSSSIKITAELSLHSTKWPFSTVCSHVYFSLIKTHGEHVMTVCTMTIYITWTLQYCHCHVYLFLPAVYLLYMYVQNIVTSSLSSYQWLEVNDVDIIDSSTSWLISSKHHRHVVVNGSKWEEWAGRGSLSSSGRGGPFTCRWNSTVFITISI